MQTMARNWHWLLAGGVLSAFAASPLLAQEAAAEAPKIDSGHTAWMLVSCALVLLMTPGLALFYGGLVRSKNVLSTMMHSMFCMGLVTVQWVVVGYSISFGEDMAGGFFGNPGEFFLLGDMSYKDVNPDLGIPQYLFVVFQMMFAIITPALISGAFAERIKFGGFALFTLLWTTLVYDPICHWVWGGGILSDQGWLKEFAGAGALDFAGGTVVHISSGISALVFAIFLGTRKGYPERPMMPHSLVLTAFGAGVLWFGWFGFNGGSGLQSDEVAGLAFTVTHICAATGALTWAIIEWIHRGKPTILGVATGLVAGLVCITPAAGFVEPKAALLMGALVALICYLSVMVVKAKLGYDDSLDAFGVHGVGGTVGAILTGVFYTVGGAEDGGAQFMAQVVATVVTVIYSVAATCILYILVDKTVGLRVTEEDEEAGLDVSEHGEGGYNL